METPSVDKIVEIELSRLKEENQLILDDNLTPFSLRVRNDMNRENRLFDSPLRHEISKSNTLDALNLELIEFPKFGDLGTLAKESEETSDEDSVGSNDTSEVRLGNLDIADSPVSQKTGYEEMDLLKIFDSKIENADISLEEFPLYEFKPDNNEVIDSEEIMKTPDFLTDLDGDEEGSIARRTRHKIKASPSPTKKSVTTTTTTTNLKKSKSKIPLPTTVIQGEIRRSKRLETQTIIPHSSTRKTCSPNKKYTNLKPVLRIKSKNSLNLIVDSSTGQLHEATQYATEINANNGEGIPLPQTMNEQVTIPISGLRRSKIPKTAIVRGFMYKIPSAKYLNGGKVGFYSEAAYKNYFSPKASPGKVIKPAHESPTKKGGIKKKRSVRWADQLEW